MWEGYHMLEGSLTAGTCAGEADYQPCKIAAVITKNVAAHRSCTLSCGIFRGYHSTTLPYAHQACSPFAAILQAALQLSGICNLRGTAAPCAYRWLG